MSSAATMEAELASVLADPTFVRSPVLARLLAYLVETTVNGGGAALKSYSVAVDGLGRSPDLDPQVDTYARVQVARLRKALDSFYVSAGAGRNERLTIDSGSYEVRLVPNDRLRPRQQPAAFHLKLPGKRLTALLVAVGLVAIVVATVALVLHWQAESRASLERWQINSFPSVTVNVKDDAAARPADRYADLIRQELLMRINRYQGIRVYYENSASSTYVINVRLQRSPDGLRANTFVVDRKSNRLAWSSSDVVDIDPGDSYFRNTPYISRTAFTIAQATGIIHSNERGRHHPTDTPYGCWLRFTMQMMNRHVVDDPVLAECAEEWHGAVPDSPTAAGLYAWTLLDQSILQVSESGRQRKIDEALQTLESARALNPTSGFLPAVATRAYAIAGEDPAMRVAADQALELNPGNLEIQGLAGTLLVFRNDPRGEGIVDDAIAHHPNPPPWHFVAKFVAAMMREDTAGAGRALEQLRQLNHTLPVLPIFTAAYEAHTGQLDKARASWKQAKRMQPILRVDPDTFLRRTPLGPAVTSRLKEWLAPVLKG